MPWQPQDLQPIFDQLLPTFEELAVSQLTERAEKAKLPAEVVREIARDARWAPPARKALDIGCPSLAAKYLNKSGISAENKPEVLVGVAVASILGTHALLLRKLDKLISSQRPAEVVKSKPASN
jgi:hypothetical protein